NLVVLIIFNRLRRLQGLGGKHGRGHWRVLPLTARSLLKTILTITTIRRCSLDLLGLAPAFFFCLRLLNNLVGNLRMVMCGAAHSITRWISITFITRKTIGVSEPHIGLFGVEVLGLFFATCALGRLDLFSERGIGASRGE